MKWRYVLAAFLLLSLVSSVAAQATASNLDASITTTGEFVMGREVTSEFDYTVNDPYVPVDTALVLDDSGSMSPDLVPPTEDAAKNYIDQTNTAQGDENAVVFFEDTASTEQSLTSSKSAAKTAVEDLEGDGGTDLPDGVSQANTALDSGSNPVQVMIVLGDGDGGNPSTEAQNARDDGIIIHGIMLGDGASSSEFGTLTDTTCDKNSDENDDGDNCWYAESDTVDQVYSSIQQQVEEETDATLRMRLRDFAYPEGTDVSATNQEYVRTYEGIEAGSYTDELEWRPTAHGSLDMVTGASELELSSGGDTNTYSFPGPETRDVKYVDFDVENPSILRRDGEVEINFTVRNEGNVESRGREVWVADGLSGDSGVNYEPENIPPLDPDSDDEEKYTLTYDTSSTNVFDSPEDIYIRADPSGRWGGTSYGHGDTLEPNEDNNIVNLGYPMRLDDRSPEPTDGVFWGDTIQPEFTYAHPEPGTVEGVYNYTNDTAQMDTNRDMDLATNPDEAVLSTTEGGGYFIDFAERWYNFTVRVEDDRGAVTISEASYYVENPKPTASAVAPGNNSFISSFPVEIISEVNDENSDYHGRNLQVTVYDHNGDYLTSGSIAPGDTILHEWEIPDALDTDYDWTVEIEDKWDTTTTTFTFTKIVGRTYRSDLAVDLNYSSIVMNAGTNQYAELTLANNVNNEKDLTLNLTGVEAEFLDGDQVKQFGSFPGQTERTYTIRITPDSPTDEDLTIVVENNNLGIETTQTIPVSVLERNVESRDVPGLGLVQLIFLTAAATVLYSVRL